MTHLSAFYSQKDLIAKYGESKAFLVWAMGLYLDDSNLMELASESLSDKSDDKKIDFIRYDNENKSIVIAQGYFSNAAKKPDSAPANKASDLNTAVAWLVSGNLEDITDEVPVPLRSIVSDCREGIEDGSVEQIELLYTHNLSESINVNKELETVALHLQTALQGKEIKVVRKELGLTELEKLYTSQKSAITITNEIICPSEIQYTEKGSDWEGAILTVPGVWLHELFAKYETELFSANYRGFLGMSKRKKINQEIRLTAEKEPDHFWVFNNGITILTHHFEGIKNGTKLTGISIINGAQTTGSIGNVDKRSLENVRVMCRLITSPNQSTTEDIIKYNNTQNKITSWDKFSNDAQQKTIKGEFQNLNLNYSLKRGFNEGTNVDFTIDQVAQPLIGLLGYYVEANTGKNYIFDTPRLYEIAFKQTKARHILLCCMIMRAVDECRDELRAKLREKKALIQIETDQLTLLGNFRFKYFLMGVIGKCFDSLRGEATVLETVAFSPNAVKNNTLQDLVVKTLPIVKLALTATTTAIGQKDFVSLLKDADLIDKETNPLLRISREANTLIYSTMNMAGDVSPAIKAFRELVSNS